jgi:lipid-A-disaccharide synthase
VVTAPPSVLVCAGEPSGDRIAAPVVDELRRRNPELRFFGAGGDALRAAGVEVRHDEARLAVTGLTEAVARAGSAARLLIDLAWQAYLRRPRLALLVDYPGVNLRLAALVRRAQIPVLYYVAPQRWAWLAFRARSLRRCIDRLAVTLPFEASWFAARGVAAAHVGHPLLDLFHAQPRAAARAALGVAGEAPVLALLPGSRSGEIHRHLPALLAALRLLPGVRPVLATLPGPGAQLCAALAPHVPQGSTAVTLGAADVALGASGSVTLEAAIAGVPMAVCYRLSALSYRAARLLVTVPWIALPNLVLEEPLLPELIQEQMTPEALAAAVRGLLEPGAQAQIRAGLVRVVQRLGPAGAAGRVADLALELSVL